MKHVTVYTDGGCQGNPGPGGWAAIVRFGQQVREVCGGEPITTNNRMELQAAIGALHALREPCQVDLFTDSEYVRQGITQWISGWKSKRWMRTPKEPVKNDDLWRRLDELASRHKVQWHWLKGHAGHPENERCDQLAGQEIAKLRKQFTHAQLAVLRAQFVQERMRKEAQAKFL